MPEAENLKISRRLAAILAADIAGYSALMGADEARTVRDLKAHQAVILPMIGTYSGRIIDTAGDGILAEFGSVVDAVECAVAIQKSMADRNAIVEPDRRMQFRIGLNLGEIIHDDARIYGDGINIAARLESIAEIGGICISGKVHDEIAGKIGIACEDLGLLQLKNIASPVRAYRVTFGHAPTGTLGLQGGVLLPDMPSIAVLPFTNMSGDSDQDFLGDGIAEDVLTELSKLRWLVVIARNSSFTYKGKAVDVRQVSRDLNVRYVLEGSVRRSGARVRITGQLIDGTTGNHVWAHRYDRELSEIFEVQDEITSAVIAGMGPAIVDAERQRAVRKLPESLGAWEAYQRGMWHMSKHVPAEMEIARTFFQRALELDANFASAQSALAWTYIMASSVFNVITQAEAAIVAEPLLRSAIAFDENDADSRARLALMLLLSGDREGAMAETGQALSINPNCPEALSVRGVALVYSGHRQEGREYIERYLRSSPKDPARPIRQAQLASAQYLDRDYEGAVRTATQAIRQSPQTPAAYHWLAAALAQLGSYVEAGATLRRLEKLSPSYLDRFARRRPPYRSTEDQQHLLEGLHKAGWKE